MWFLNDRDLVFRLSIITLRENVLSKLPDQQSELEHTLLGSYLQFIPSVLDVRRCSNRSYFWDSIILHALDLAIVKNISVSSVAQDLLELSNLNIFEAISILRQHLNSEFVFYSNDLNQSRSFLFNCQLYARIETFFRQSHPYIMSHIELFWANLHDSKLRKKVRNKANKKVTNTAEIRLVEKKRLQVRRAEMNKGWEDEFNEDDVLHWTEFPHPNFFYNAAQHPLKTLMSFCINSGHAYFPAISCRIPHSSVEPAMTRKAWYENADMQDKVRLLLQRGGLDTDEDAKRTAELESLDKEVQDRLEALHSSDGIPDSAYRLLDLLRCTDLPDFNRHENPMVAFLTSQRFRNEPESVRQLIIDEYRFHEASGDKSERYDVRTILEAALPNNLMEWLHLIRIQDLSPELQQLLDKIRQQNVSDDVIEERMTEFKRRIHLEALLPTCCSCGIRSDYVLKDDLVTLGARSPQKKADSRRENQSTVDLFANRPVKSSYVKVTMQTSWYDTTDFDFSFIGSTQPPSISGAAS